MAHHASGSGNKGAHEREAARPEASSEIEEQPEYVRRARERVRPAAGSTVVYPDDSGITRPLDLPRTQWIILGAILAAAILFAAIWCVRTVGDVLNYEANTKQEVSQVIRRGVALDVVKLSDYVGKDSAAMQAEMAAAGLAIVDVTTVQANDTNAIDLVKLPSDMSAAEALLAYTKGVDEMPATEAAKFLSGSWRLTQQTVDSTDVRVRYADFAADDAAEAIENAIEVQGFDESTVIDEGVDSKNNTYKAGKTTIGDATYTWQVSACALTDAYDVDGLPASAQYVGVHLYIS